MKTTIYIIRHAQSNANISKKTVLQKHLKRWGSRLSITGKQEAHEVADLLSEKQFTAIYSSALTRARHTAKIIARKHKLRVSQMEDLHERFYGTDYFHLSKTEKIAVRSSVEQFENESKKLHHRFSSDGESAIESATRLKNALEELAYKHNGQTIALVSHGAVMRMFLVLIGWAHYNQLPTKTIENTGYFVLEIDGDTIDVTKTVGVHKKT